ncbi:type II toxin-antitoxin system RelE/ParE family toxin [Nocardioides sp. SLBN-35]|uniref:type II toxin-antitoxin system RelE/ParE family toxin n=1 Tax=Nocardioides sp. SLBN-35 TaxID=2768445 RepID=UPI00116DDF1E|nr:type II toxin-antitoxin system RelE/ParE family toxin [Nocardioides sp. SLBN-35]TQK71446.1 plasmid stabilization system protein ParE [Nocardioides sp. SLBN-35]
MTVRLTTLAAADLEEIVEHYDEHASGLGAEFLQSFDRVIERLQMFPDGAPPVDGLPGVRRVRVRRFPYGVFYRAARGDVLLLRVLHARRDVVGQVAAD